MWQLCTRCCLKRRSKPSLYAIIHQRVQAQQPRQGCLYRWQVSAYNVQLWLLHCTHRAISRLQDERFQQTLVKT